MFPSLSTSEPRAAVRRLAIGRLISIVGTDASAIALGWALFEQTHSPIWLSVSLLITIGGGSVLAPLGGWLADRVDRRRLMIVCELASAGFLLSLAFVHAPWALLAISVLATASGAAFGPAAGAAIADIAGPDELNRANGLMATGANVGRMAGRLGAGALMALLGVGPVFALDALSFVASAALTASIALPFGRERAVAAPCRRSLATTLGLDTVFRDDLLRLLVASACISTFATSFSMTAEVPLAMHLGAGPIGLGLLAAGWGVGMTFGSWHARQALHAGNEATGVLVGRVTMALGIGLVAVAPWLPMATACYVLGGLGGGFMGVAAQSLIVRRAPEQLRARVLAATDACRNLTFAAGVLVAGAVVAALGPQPVYALVGVGVLIGCAPLAALVGRLGGLRPLRPATA